MKAKVTKKQVKESYSNILKLGYCDLQHLLNHFSPSYYTSGIYGWKADIYEIDGMCICTGYDSFGTIRPDYKDVERMAKAYDSFKALNLSYEAEINEAKRLLKSLFTK